MRGEERSLPHWGKVARMRRMRGSLPADAPSSVTCGDSFPQRGKPLFTPCQLSVFIDPSSFFRHGVKAEFAKRVAAQNAPQRQKQALDDTVGLQCLNGIVAAGRDKPAMPGRMGADVLLVKADQRHQQPGHDAAGGTGAALSGRPALANSLPSVLLSCVLFKRGV